MRMRCMTKWSIWLWDKAHAKPSCRGCTLREHCTPRLIPYSEDFLMLARPMTRTGQAKIFSSRGITVNSLHYWHEQMRSPQVWGKTVPVRYEPYDMGVAYAFIEGQWLECIGGEYAQVHGRSER